MERIFRINKVTVLFLILTSSILVFSQEQDSIVIVKNLRIVGKKFYNKGIIFSKEVTMLIPKIKNCPQRFTPTFDEIVNAEIIFVKKYNFFIMQSPNIYYFEIPTNARKDYKKWNRQYIGYINASGDKIILIVLLNFTNKIKARHHFKNFKNKCYFFAYDGFYAKNIETYLINLSKKQICSNVEICF